MRHRNLKAVCLCVCVLSGYQVQATVLDTVKWEAKPVAPRSYALNDIASMPPNVPTGLTVSWLLDLGQSVLSAIGDLIGPQEATAAIIETEEWESMPGDPWSKNSPPVIDCAVSRSPSGGCALKMTYQAGTYATSIGGGRLEYAIPNQPTELYMGHWIKWSSPFDWNPVGTKIDYLTMRDPADAAGHRDNFLTMIQNNGTTLTFTQQLWNAPGTQNRYPNRGSVNIQKNRWYWFEIHGRLNTVGQANGFLEIWLDDVLLMQHSDVTYRTTNTPWGQYQHSPEWGGGGGTINQQQYLWFDHTVISTTRIGVPGGVATRDTTSPSPPFGLRVQ